MTQARIQRIGPSDIITITQMIHANMTGVDQRFTRWVNDPLSRFFSYLALPLYFLFAGQGYKAVRDERIMGCAYIHLRDVSGYIFNVNVNRPYRRQGVATQLMNHLEAVTLTHNRRWVALQVDAGNAPAQRLYEELGYRQYHPHFLRSESLPAGNKLSSGEISLQRLSHFQGRQIYRRFQKVERLAGDAWAAQVVREYDFERLRSGTFWRCLNKEREVGCIWQVAVREGTVRSGVAFKIVLAQDTWGVLGVADVLREMVRQSNQHTTRIDVYLGSSTHHRVAAPELVSAGFTICTQPRILMLKSI
jgi:GNAT superfamily N-acetyltransferase